MSFILQSICIVRNKLVYIHEWAFHGLTNLHTLKIEKSELSSPPSLSGIRGGLSVLTVTYAKLTSIPTGYFAGCNKLSDLDLRHNRLNTVPDLSAISDTIYTFLLGYNDLTDIRPLQDFSFPNLGYLSLDHNKIQQVDLMHFNSPRLFGMSLSHNLLQELGHPKSLVRGSDREDGPRAVNVRLHLSGNPWYCNEKLSWIVSAVKGWDHYTGTVELHWNGSSVFVADAQAMICHFPANVRGTPAINLGM